MGRKRSYWLRRFDNCWYTTANGKKVKLGTGDEPKGLIEQRFRELVSLTTPPDTLTVRHLSQQYLGYCERHRSPSTHRWYRDFLDPFCASVKPTLAVERLTPAIVDRWITNQYGSKSPSTRHGAARAVTRMVNWAISERLIDRSPLVGFTKPAATSRAAMLTKPQYEKCLIHAKGPMKDVVKFLWHTGCRPQELRIIEWKWVDGSKVVLPVAKSKGKKKRRVIYLDDTAKEIVHRLSADFLTGPIFRNNRDKPWTKNALYCAFKRLRAKTGIEGLCAYSLRHGFATRKLREGIDIVTVAALLGDSVKTVATVYAHVDSDESYLLSVLNGSNGAISA